MELQGNRRTALLVGISGSHNSFSLSLYNLKSYAYQFPDIVEHWNILTIQHPFISVVTEAYQLPALIDKIIETNPYLVGFSCYMWNIKAFAKVASEIRQRTPDCKILWGGPEMTSDYLREGVYQHLDMDYVISGEGEKTFAELLSHLTKGASNLEQIQGLSYWNKKFDQFVVNDRRQPFRSLLEIPSPFLSGIVDEELFARKDLEGNIETQRGCSLRCSYCIYHKDMDRITYSTVERVIAEVKVLVDRGVRKIRFVDANFTSNLEFAKEVMGRLIEEKFELRLMFELIPGFIDDEIASLFGSFNGLHEWNAITVGVGVQTINHAVLKKVRRGIKVEKFDLTFDLLQKNDVYVKIDLIIGLPSETIESIEATLEYMLEKLRNGQSHLLCCHLMRGLPGTELLSIANEYGMIFSSEREPHELVESPALPRSELVKCLRRTAVVFRLVNHAGWASREFITDATSNDTSICRAFFRTREVLAITSIQLVDLIIDELLLELSAIESWFCHPDFPYAETWWWNRAGVEVDNEWILECLERLTKAGRNSCTLLAATRPPQVNLD